MDTVIFLFFFAFIVYGFFSGGKTTKRTKKRLRSSRPNAANRSPSPQTQTPWRAENEVSDEDAPRAAQPVKTITARDAMRLANLGKARVERAQQKMRELQRGGESIDETVKSKNVVDKNIYRRSDWGVRAGPGVLSSRNLLILVAIALALMLLSQIPTHVFL